MPELLLEPMVGSALSRANPFPGLRPYEEADADWFFGRGGEINELLKRLRRLHFVAIVGASGSGKSSLVRAGVLPQIRDGYLDASWKIAAFRPGEQPIANLAEAVCPAGISADEFTVALRSGSQGLVHGLGSAPGKVLILVDQFEELFQFARRTGDAAQEEVKEFLKLLLAAANSEEVDVYVVITMRLEWLNECATYQGLAEAINEGIYLVPQMTRRQFQQAILGPLESADGSITTALLGRMLNDLDNKSDQLPVLQHALMRIWERTGASRASGEADAFDTKDYEAVGTFSNCLSAHAEEVYGELSDREKVVAELLFRNITQVYQNRKIRRPRPVSELLQAMRVSAAELTVVIQAFSKAGRSFLVTTEGALTPASIVDVSHEALIRQWVRLCGWVEDEEDKQSRVSRLEVDAAEWARDRKRFKGSLYRGYRLQRAEELRPALMGTTTALAFLNESSREKLRQRIVKRGSITIGLLLLVAFAFVLYSVRSRGLLEVARAQRQQAEAEARASGLQAKKAQDFQADLVKKIDAAKGSATALAAIAEEIQAKRVYVQYVPAESGLVGSVQGQLKSHGYAVPGLEQVAPGRAPGQVQVRFFHPEDQKEAGKIAGLLRGTVPGAVGLMAGANLNGVVPLGQFEVWLVPGTMAMVADKGPNPPAPSTVSVPAVAPTPAPIAVPEPQISASVSQEKITSGRSVTLSWLTTNATEVEIEGIGRQGPRGSVSVTPQATTTYRLTAKGAGGTSAPTMIAVEVAAAAAPAPAPIAPTAAPVATATATGGSEQAAVRAAMTRYREAYESESLDDVRKAWPSVSKNDQKNMKFIFDQFNAVRLTLNYREDDIHIDGAGATVTCRQTVTFTQKGKKLPEQTSPGTFRLKKTGGSWVVDGVQ